MEVYKNRQRNFYNLPCSAYRQRVSNASFALATTSAWNMKHYGTDIYAHTERKESVKG